MPTKNPRPWEIDESLPGPDQESWSLIKITVERTDGGIVDAELIRPKSWINSNSLAAGKALPLNLPELEVGGLATVTSIERLPEIASGEGSVVTARFLTREVNVIARVEVLAADGRLETIEGTLIHPIWSVDRQDWVPLGELEEGEQLQCTLPSPYFGRGIEDEGRCAQVLSVTVLQRTTPVYNIEVHGEHVYQVGVLGVLVHNASPARCALIAEYGEAALKNWQAAHIIPKNGWKWAPKELSKIIKRVTQEGLIDDVANLFLSTPGHAGTHTAKFVDDVIIIMKSRTSRESMVEGIDELWSLIKAGAYL